jgi:transposase
MVAKSPYSPELRQRAMRIVCEVRHQYQSEWVAIIVVAEMLWIGTAETLRTWVRGRLTAVSGRPGIMASRGSSSGSGVKCRASRGE